MPRPLAPLLAALAVLLAPAGATALGAPVPVSACTMGQGEATCDFLCAPGVLVVVAQGPVGASVRATCGTASLGCTILTDKCWAVTIIDQAGVGRCVSNATSLAACGSA